MSLQASLPKSNKLKVVALVPTIISLFLFFSINHALATEVIGFISSNTTWTVSKSPYVTLGNIIVKEGVTLTVEPGVKIKFGPGHSLTINGALIARGTPKKGIKFTTKQEEKPGAWGGILFEELAENAQFDNIDNYISGSILQYCTIEFAQTAIKANSTSPFISYCIIRNNETGILISKGDFVVIRDSTVRDNHNNGIFIEDTKTVKLINNKLTKNIGGGIYMRGSNVIISGNTFTQNNESAIYAQESDISVTTNTFSGNGPDGQGETEGSEHSYGGAIYMKGGAANITNNEFANNKAVAENWYRDAYGYGGAIYVERGNATIKDNTFSGNSAVGSSAVRDGKAYGGAIYIKESNATIRDNTFSGNSAVGRSHYWSSNGYSKAYGGAIYVEKGDATISANIFGKNEATSQSSSEYSEESYGGAIYTQDSGVIIRDNTFNKNQVEDDGGAVYVGDKGRIINNKFIENMGSRGSAIYYSGSQEITGNLIANNLVKARKNRKSSVIYIRGNPVFTKNTIVENQESFTLYYAQPKESPNLDATNNYWGAATETEVRVKIYDFFADSTRAFVDIVPFSKSISNVELTSSGAKRFNTTGWVKNFEGGSIYYHTSGKLTEQAFAVTGNIYQKYKELEAEKGWLGFPIVAWDQVPIVKEKQDLFGEHPLSGAYGTMNFEGGFITTNDNVNYEAFAYEEGEIKIAFTMYGEKNNSDVYVTTGPKDITNLTKGSIDGYYPSWSPDGNKIAFISERSGTFGIYAMNPDGSSVHRIAEIELEEVKKFEKGPINELIPYTWHTWLPNGKSTFFSKGQIFTITADGTELEQLTFPEEVEFRTAIGGTTRGVTFNYHPIFLPSERIILSRVGVGKDFWGDTSKNLGQFSMNADGSGLREASEEEKLLAEWVTKFSGSFSSSRERVAFIYKDNLYTANLSGKNVRKVMKIPKPKKSIDWQVSWCLPREGSRR